MIFKYYPLASNKLVCYYTNWSQYRPSGGAYYPEDVDPNLCTHINYAFAKLNNDQLEFFEWNDEGTHVFYPFLKSHVLLLYHV